MRDAPNVTGPITYVELATGEYDRDELKRRREQGTLTLGRALVAGLLQACLDAGVTAPDRRARARAAGRRRGRDRHRRLRARRRARAGLPARADARARRRARRAGRRAAAGDGRGRRAGLHERGLVVPGDQHPGRDDRRRADVPADPHRARAGGLADRRLDRPPLRQRGPELQRPRPRAAGLRPRALRLPPRAGVADLRRHLPRDVPARPAQPPRSRPRVAGDRARPRGAGARRSTSRPRRWRRPSRASTRAPPAARTRTSAAARIPTTASSARSARSSAARTTRCACCPAA